MRFHGVLAPNAKLRAGGAARARHSTGRSPFQGQHLECRVPCPVGPWARKRAFEFPIPKAQLGAFLQALAEKLRGGEGNALASTQPGALLNVSA